MKSSTIGILLILFEVILFLSGCYGFYEEITRSDEVKYLSNTSKPSDTYTAYIIEFMELYIDPTYGTKDGRFDLNYSAPESNFYWYYLEEQSTLELTTGNIGQNYSWTIKLQVQFDCEKFPEEMTTVFLTSQGNPYIDPLRFNTTLWVNYY